ncbi:DUF523 and DUF1722 domain-containing protein [Aliivibrio kagoshimensis]
MSEQLQNSHKMDKVKVGISACLLGHKVRFDGGHKRSHFCAEALAEYVEYQTFCPEVAVGLPVPRPTIRQIDRGGIIHVSTPDGSSDVTTLLNEYGEQVASSIDSLSAFIFTAKSPSCGMERVKVWQHDGKGSKSDGIGLFAAKIMTLCPNLPCEESGRLNDPVIRENFILRMYAYHKWQSLLSGGMTKHKLVQFHSQYKYTLMSHQLVSYRQLGRLVASAEKDIDQLAQQYIKLFMQTLKIKSNRKTHTTTLQHVQGYFSRYLESYERVELTKQVHAYRLGIVPLLVPLTLLRHYLLKYPNPYLSQQTYFHPYPEALRLLG